MHGNGILQTCVGTGVAGAALALSAILGVPTFASKFNYGAYGDPVLFGVSTASNPPVFVFTAIGHLSDASTLVIDRVLSTWDGATADDTSPAAIALASGVTYHVYPVFSAGSLVGAWPGISGDVIGSGSPDSKRALLLPGGAVLAGSTMTLAANTLYSWAARWPYADTIKRLYYGLTTAVAAANVRIGVWAMRHDGGRGRLLADSGNLPGAAGSLIGATISDLRPSSHGFYVGLMSDSAVGIRAYTPSDPGAHGWGAGTAHYYISHYSVVRAFSSGLPDPLPAPTTGQTNASNGSTPAVWGGL